MPKTLSFLVLLTCLCPVRGVLSSQAAGKASSRNWKVEGTIMAARNDGTVCYLNFSTNWSTDFNAVIFAKDFSKFPPTPESYYRGKYVEVTGPVGDYMGKQEIILSDRSQIRMLNATAASPAYSQSQALLPAAPPGPVYRGLDKEHHIVRVLDGGATVTLDDGSKWEVFPMDRKDTANWQSTGAVIVGKMTQPMGKHAYILMNKEKWQQAFAAYLGSK